ncbi:cytochrome-c peroxidase [Marinihelvus fidelis]|uniref:Cytochrome-c peroxidase n=1 Tax=Marinihelvus fidelis TaxID=2613842 RepID=A0A5N0TG94_9GAMM|nr:parallel beta-helix domain-containing protein [Marinihelvus fidelis]KAA9133147.1 cytochrome-c peroxidase [Marinihelvus fidelis]
MTRTPIHALVALCATVLSCAPLYAATLEVRDGESIQAAVTRASPGDTVLVYPGKYEETVYIDKDDITLRGVVEENEWPVLEGGRTLNDAVLYSGNNITVEWLKIMHFKGNAIMGQAGNNFTIRYNWVVDTGVYGIFPQYGQNGLVAYNVISGIEDAAIYVGMSDNIDVIGNEVFDSVAGIEIENSRHALVEANYVHDNTGGILVFITPGLPIKTTYDVIVRGNFVVNNNTPNFGAPGSIVAGIPAGSGMVIMAADDVRIEDNIITGNKNAGIIVVDLSFAANVTADPESEPNPDRVAILENFFNDNGEEPVTEIKALMMASKFTTHGPDVIAAGGAEDDDNCIVHRDRILHRGVDDWTDCEVRSTRDITTMMLPDGAPPRDTDEAGKAQVVYNGICAGCHGYDVRMVGPATVTIQALYHDDAQRLADYIASPEKRRPDYPAMPPQAHLPEDLRLAVAEYMLGIKK